jgi:hypothetical protein
MLSFDQIKPRDRFVTRSGQIYTVKHVYTGSQNPEHDYVQLTGGPDCERGRVNPKSGWRNPARHYDFSEKDLDWLAELTHEVFTVTQKPRTTQYWVNAECYMEDERVGRSVYRMADDICDDGTSNLTCELAEIAAQLDRDSYQIVHNGREARYNRVVIEVQIEHGQCQKDEYRPAQQVAV